MGRGGPRKFKMLLPGWEERMYPHSPDGMSREEVAAELGCSYEAVRQVENRAMAKLRRICGSEFQHRRVGDG